MTEKGEENMLQRALKLGGCITVLFAGMFVLLQFTAVLLTTIDGSSEALGRVLGARDVVMKLTGIFLGPTLFIAIIERLNQQKEER